MQKKILKLIFENFILLLIIYIYLKNNLNICLKRK